MKEQDAGTLLYITTSGPPFSGFWGSNCVIATSPGQLHTFDIIRFMSQNKPGRRRTSEILYYPSDVGARRRAPHALDFDVAKDSSTVYSAV